LMDAWKRSLGYAGSSSLRLLAFGTIVATVVAVVEALGPYGSSSFEQPSMNALANVELVKNTDKIQYVEVLK
ncbi:hypothetical protein E4T56_gene20597, partial [Termitomyces sp. T112]